MIMMMFPIFSLACKITYIPLRIKPATEEEKVFLNLRFVRLACIGNMLEGKYIYRYMLLIVFMTKCEIFVFRVTQVCPLVRGLFVVSILVEYGGYIIVA